MLKKLDYQKLILRSIRGFCSYDRRIFEKDEKVALVGFGSFSVSERVQEQVEIRKPENNQIPAKKVVRFKAGAELEGQR
ncbi:MAG: HU family DNA-binding protein [Butyricimonas faecihominis]